MSNHYLQVIAHYYAKPENTETVKGLLASLAVHTRQEPANLYYDYFQSPAEPNHFVILEKYSDASGLDAHRQTSHFQEIGLGKVIPLLERREVESHMVTPPAA